MTTGVQGPGGKARIPSDVHLPGAPEDVVGAGRTAPPTSGTLWIGEPDTYENLSEKNAPRAAKQAAFLEKMRGVPLFGNVMESLLAVIKEVVSIACGTRRRMRVGQNPPSGGRLGSPFAHRGSPWPNRTAQSI